MATDTIVHYAIRHYAIVHYAPTSTLGRLPLGRLPGRFSLGRNFLDVLAGWVFGALSRIKAWEPRTLSSVTQINIK